MLQIADVSGSNNGELWREIEYTADLPLNPAVVIKHVGYT